MAAPTVLPTNGSAATAFSMESSPIGAVSTWRLLAITGTCIVLARAGPDIGLPVVKVIVPGLRHFWRRLGPGRLYDVPARMGWVDAPLAEDQLNPVHVFF